jgi:hypothetical protein
MNKNDFGTFDSLKEISEDDFSFSSRIIGKEIYEGFINVFKYSFSQYPYTEYNEQEIAYLLPTNNKSNFDTKELYWQAFMFFKRANYTLCKFDIRSQTLIIKNNLKPESICDNSVRCGGYGWERYIFYKENILCHLDQSNRFHWYFPYLNNDEKIQYCYLFELTEMGANRENKKLQALAERSPFNVDFRNQDE